MTTGKDHIPDHVSSLPAKDFFVLMLTRDIDLHDAILDLIDNCIDGAIRTRSAAMARSGLLEGYWAKITFNEKEFIIEDNCGGIPLKLAEEYAFRLGRPDETIRKEGTIGVVGIGMKRAIFKMARQCEVHSHHKKDDFVVKITPEWFKKDDLWTFDMEGEGARSRSHGTKIVMSSLTEAAALAFGPGSTFASDFPRIVAETYSYLMAKGFDISINDTKVERRDISILFEKDSDLRSHGALVRPYIFKGLIEGVRVFLAVGYRSRLRTDAEDDEDRESSYAARDAGWTIVCNDRVIVSCDRSLKTGWGLGGVPHFHNQFSSIAGIVEFEASDTRKLPMTTTKRGVDVGRDIFLLVRQKMQDGTKLFTRNTGRWKGDEQDLKQRFEKIKGFDLVGLKQLASDLALSPVRGETRQWVYRPELPEKKKHSTSQRISFVRETKLIEQVSKYLFEDIVAPSVVGEACFDKLSDKVRVAKEK